MLLMLPLLSALPYRRLKHIIEQYADGPGVLLELVQNADDAAASEISFLLDTQTYASNSVLGTAAPWEFGTSFRGTRLLVVICGE